MKRALQPAFKAVPLTLLLMWVTLIIPSYPYAFMNDEDIGKTQVSVAGLSLGDKLSFWASTFVGTPYDTDPLGAYVTNRAVKYDEAVDCMYLVFRVTELALSNTPSQSVDIALDKRFKTHGIVDESGKVVNYSDRFMYAIDMILSGKWGEDITKKVGETVEIRGERGIAAVSAIPASTANRSMAGLKSGDIVFFVKYPSRRVNAEIIGHMGILKRKADKLYLIHASGVKGTLKAAKASYKVVETDFGKYVSTMPFAGIIVTRF
ncbi:MAG: hypothetical protein HQK89_14320 [Nitrospirae bacterium]|nr:hypothetical protein [Nitrospirota bacterium]